MSTQIPSILVVEDSKADLFLIREALAASGIEATVNVVHDGHQALNYIDAIDRCPELVLLDLNLPRKDGIEVLRHIRNSAICRSARVLIVSSSDSQKDKSAVTELGFSGYFRKPSVYAEFMELGTLVQTLLSPD